MPVTIPKPTLQPNGKWKIRFTVPADLRKLGFMEGKHEWIQLHEPCQKNKAMVWAARLYEEFCTAKERFRQASAVAITPELIREARILKHQSQDDEDADFALDALINETLDKSMALHGVELDPSYDSEWDSLEATSAGRKVIADIDLLVGKTIDHAQQLKEWLAIKPIDEKTKSMYLSDVEAFLAQASRSKPFTRAEISNWYQDLLTGGQITKKTAQRKLGAIKGYHQFLVHRALIELEGDQGSPFNALNTERYVAAKSGSQTRAWTDTEALTLYRAVRVPHPELSYSVAIAMFTGARIESIFRLKKKDFHRDDLTLLVGAEGDKTQAGQNRLIPVHPEIVTLLTWLAERITDASEYLLQPSAPHAKKRSHSEVKKFSRIKDNLFPGEKRKATFHSFRSSFITKLANEAMAPDHFIKDIVGHENSKGMKKDITMDLYRQRARTEELRPYVERVAYEGWTSIEPPNF